MIVPFNRCLFAFLTLASIFLKPIQTVGGEAKSAEECKALFTQSLTQLINWIEPPPSTAPISRKVEISFLDKGSMPKALAGKQITLTLQAPDKLYVKAEIDKRIYEAGRNGQELWVYTPQKNFGVIGQPGLARFSTAPNKLDQTRLPAWKFPIPREQALLIPLLTQYEVLKSEIIQGVSCQFIQLVPFQQARDLFKIPEMVLTLALRESDSLPAHINLKYGKSEYGLNLKWSDSSQENNPDNWTITQKPGDRIEKVALSHLTSFAKVAWQSLNQKIPVLGPVQGTRKLVAEEGKGRLELIDETRVLFLEGSPIEMGTQHGKLLRKEIKDLVNQILYGVGVGSSFDKGRWFFGEIESAQKRLMPYMDPKYIEEMDAIANAAGLEREEVRLANFFPELFHCSGFALKGKSTQNGTLYHGRILDYLRGLGLEQNAVVMVMKPSYGNAWVNISYAGFVGSVTAMNEKGVAMGEMGGKGEGNWDGKPMAQLLREVMEKSNTLEQGLEIMRKGPLTCEYYYVLSDGKTRNAVGIAATHKSFQVVEFGQAHPQLPDAIEDTVLLSAGDRYKLLVQRVKEKYGRIDAAAARDLMKRPVAMNSNIHSVLFAPETLDFWVANADSENVASHTRFTQYNLKELLKPQEK